MERQEHAKKIIGKKQSEYTKKRPTEPKCPKKYVALKGRIQRTSQKNWCISYDRDFLEFLYKRNLKLVSRMQTKGK